MDGQEKQIKEAVKQLGEKLHGDTGKQIQEMTQEMMQKQLTAKSVLGITDSMAEGLYSQAYRLYNTGKYKDAAELFRLLIMIDTTEPKYVMGMGACFHMMKDYKSAAHIYSMCGMLEPDNPIPHYHASDCFVNMKDYVSAIVSLEMAVKRAGEDPKFEALKDRAKMNIESLKKKLRGDKPETEKPKEEKAEKKMKKKKKKKKVRE